MALHPYSVQYILIKIVFKQYQQWRQINNTSQVKSCVATKMHKSLKVIKKKEITDWPKLKQNRDKNKTK